MRKNVTVKTTTPKPAASQIRSQAACTHWGKAPAGPAVTQAGSGHPANPGK